MLRLESSLESRQYHGIETLVVDRSIQLDPGEQRAGVLCSLSNHFPGQGDRLRSQYRSLSRRSPVEADEAEFAPSTTPSQQQQHETAPSGAQSRVSRTEKRRKGAENPKFLGRTMYHLSNKKALLQEEWALVNARTNDEKFKRYFDQFEEGPVWASIPKQKLLRSQMSADLWVTRAKPKRTKAFKEKAFRLHYRRLMTWQNWKHAQKRLDTEKAKQPPNEALIEKLESEVYSWETHLRLQQSLEEDHCILPFLSINTGYDVLTDSL